MLDPWLSVLSVLAVLAVVKIQPSPSDLRALALCVNRLVSVGFSPKGCGCPPTLSHDHRHRPDRPFV